MYVRLSKYPTPLWDRVPGAIRTRLTGTFVHRFIEYLCEKFNARVECVKIEPHDVWNLDSDLAKIIAPALMEIRTAKSGVPHIDLADIPLDKRRYIDSGHCIEHWEYILDEMIYTFQNYKTFPSPSTRQKNGLRLFGKYYTALWD